MLFISIYFFIYVYFFYFDLLPIYKDKNSKLYTLNLMIILLSFTIVVLKALNIKVPNPSDLIEGIVRIITG